MKKIATLGNIGILLLGITKMEMKSHSFITQHFPIT